MKRIVSSSLLALASAVVTMFNCSMAEEASAVPGIVGQSKLISSAFDCYIPFTVSGYKGKTELKNFPVLVRLSNQSPDGFFYYNCADDGSDIRFADAEGNLIPHEIDTWNPNGESLIWVRLPTVTANTVFRMYYASFDPGTPSSDDVWASYAAVIHGGSAITNVVSGGPSVASPSDETMVYAASDAGRVGGGIRKSVAQAIGVNISMGTTSESSTLDSTGKFTVSGWFKRNGNGGNKDNGTHVLGASRSGWDKGYGFLWLQEVGTYISVAAHKAHQFTQRPDSPKLADKVWGHVAFAYEKGVSLATYFDGALDNYRASPKASPGDLVSSAGIWTFGSYADTASIDSFVGDMDELRIFDGVASDDWIRAEYDTVSEDSFLTVGSVQSNNPHVPRISAVAVVEDILRLDVSCACTMDGATLTYRLAAPGEDPQAAIPVVVTASSTANEMITFPIAGLNGNTAYTIVLEAAKNGYTSRPVEITASPFAETVSFTPSVSGNDALVRTGGDEVHVLSASGTFTLDARRRVRLLAVGGGGGSGWTADTSMSGAGGGAGGFVEMTDLVLDIGTYRYEVGAGGAASRGQASKGANGGDTVLYHLNPETGAETLIVRAFGGGGGGSYDSRDGAGGGSGGGGMFREIQYVGAPGSGTIGQGNAGGGWIEKPSSKCGSSGGGGAGAPGEPGSETKGGDGGDGRASDITGAEIWYAGGGGASRVRNSDQITVPGKGGKGGGGSGADYGWYAGDSRLDGEDGLGGGGGGGFSWYTSSSGATWYRCYGGRGGAGTLILRFKADAAPSPTLASVSAALTGRTEATFTGTVVWEGDGASGADVVLTYDGINETVATGLGQGDAFSFEKAVRRGTTAAWSVKLVNSLGAESAPVSGTLSVPSDEPVEISVSGASETRMVGTDAVAVFTDTSAAGSFTVPAGGAWVEMLVVGGGGAGGRAWDRTAGGGGGAGGLVYRPALFLGGGTYSVTVGAGGAGREHGVKSDSGRPGRSGGASYVTLNGIDIVRAYGGSGGAGCYAGNLTNCANSVGLRKGSTGGAGCARDQDISVAVSAQIPDDPAQGNPGGASGVALVENASGSGSYWFVGGGGGAGAPGADGDPSALLSGAGGDGVPCSITGETVWYAGGGGAGSHIVAPGNVYGAAAPGGRGGGGYGQRWKSAGDADNKGVDGLGGGGGGGGTNNGNNDKVDASIAGHSGGSGTVILRWRSLPLSTIAVSAQAPVAGVARGSFSGRVETVGGDGESVTLEIGLSADGKIFKWTTVATDLVPGQEFSAAIDGLAVDTVYTAVWRATNISGLSATGDFGSFRTAGAYLVPGADVSGATVAQVGQDRVYTYTNIANGTFTVNAPGYARILLAGGGGAGGWSYGGGGGGGGVIEEDLVWLEAGTYAIEVGAGGTPSTSNGARGGNGGDSVVVWCDGERNVELYRAYGGGGGGSWNDNSANCSGGTGGSGGGGTYRNGRYAGKALDPAQGCDGAPGLSYKNSWDWFSPGGGGGAGAPGVPALENHTVPGAGGAGRVSDISGRSEQYGAGGGAGGPYNNRALSGVGGDGIGGHGRRRDQAYWTGDEAGRSGYGGGGGGGAPNGSNDDSNASFNRRPGAPGGSGAVIIRFTAAGDTGLPDAAVVAAEPAADDPTAAAVKVLVRSLGKEASATLELAYGSSRSNLPMRRQLGTVSSIGTVDAVLTGLVPGKTYYVAAAIRSAGGETVTRAVKVALPAVGAGGGLGEPGLWQAQWLRSATNREPDIWDSVSTKNVVAGTIAAFGKGDAVDPFTGLTYAWGGLHTMFLYKGAIFLRGNTTYTFGGRMDDSLYLKIGDKELLDTKADPTHSVFADFTAPWTGWYPIDVRLGNEVGSAYGPDGDGVTSWTGFALAFNTEGSRTMMPESGWTPLIDSGDGSLLQAEIPDLRYADVKADVSAGVGLTLTAGVAPGTDKVRAYLCCGPAWGGNSPTDWAQNTDLGEVDAATAVTALAPVTVAGWGESVFVAAVALIHPDCTVTWSEPVTYAGTSLVSLSAAATDWSQGDELEVSFTVAGGVAPFTVQLFTGSGPGNLSRAAQTVLSAPGSGSLKATGLVPGQYCYWSVIVTDAAGTVASSAAAAQVLMPSGAEYLNESNGISWSLDQREVTLNGAVKALGAGENRALLYLTDNLSTRWSDIRHFYGSTTNSGESVVLTENGAFSIKRRFDWGEEIGFNWVVSNSNGRLSWTTPRMPDWNSNDAASRGHFWVGDYQTYTWKGGTGFWNNPEMWEPDGTKTHDQFGYPITGSYVMFPEGIESEVLIPATDKPLLSPVSFEVPNGASVTLKAAEGVQSLGFWRIDAPLQRRRIYVRENASLVVSGVKGRWGSTDNGEVTLEIAGKNSYLEFTDGADIDIGWQYAHMGISDWSNNRSGRGIRFTKDAKVYIRGSLGMAGPNEYVIDDAQVTMAPSGNRDDCRVDFALRDGGRLVFRGEHPLLQANNRFAATTGNNPDGAPEQFVDFEIPAGGFAEAPLRSRAGNTLKLGVTGSNNRKIVFRVPADSPAATSGAVIDQPLIWWPAGKEEWIVLDNANLPHPDTDYWYETFDDLTGEFTGWGVHIVGRAASEKPRIIGLTLTNLVSGAATAVFSGIPGDGAAGADFSVALERIDNPADTSSSAVLSPSGSVTAGTAFMVSLSGLADGGSYRLSVIGVDSDNAALSCTETLVFDALTDYAEASTSSVGATTEQDGAFTVWTFTDTASEGVFTVTRPGVARVLVVGGGGGGGGSDRSDNNGGETRRGGGGGGGGEVVEAELFLQAGDYRIVVGAGGEGGAPVRHGNNGGWSTFGYLVNAYGGGGGGGNWNNGKAIECDGRPGANGGGAAGSGHGGAATSAAGFSGGEGTYTGWANWSNCHAGGGGGSSAASGGDAGLDADNMFCGGRGADGVPSDITGAIVYYGGGGGGGGAGLAFGPGTGGFGGKGGGGEGRMYLGTSVFSAEKADGTDGLGGGGGGGSGCLRSGVDAAIQANIGGSGGSGVVIVRMRTIGETAAPQVAVRSAEPAADGIRLSLDVQSSGIGAESTDILFVYDRASDYDGAAGFSCTNVLGRVSETGVAGFTVCGLRPGTDYIGAVIAVNAAGSAEVPVGEFRTDRERHADAESGVVEGSWDVDSWVENDSGVFVDNLLRAANGTTVHLAQNRYKSSSWGANTANQGGSEADMIDGIVNRTNNRYIGYGTNVVMVFTLPEQSAVSAFRFYAGWGVGSEWSPISIERIDVRSAASEVWTPLAGSAFLGDKTTSWGTVAQFAAGGENWLARDVRQIRVLFNRNSQRDGTMYWEIEADGVAEADAPAVHARAGDGRPLSPTSSLRTSTAFSGVVSSPAHRTAFTDVTAFWGPVYGGEDENAWAHSRQIGTMTAAASSLAFTLAQSEFDNAVYVRYRGIGEDGTVSWSDSVFVPDLEIQTDVPPVVVFSSCSAASGTTATLEAALVSAGSLATAQAADVTLEYTLDPNGFEEGGSYASMPFASGVSVGAIPAVTVSPLRASRRYYARFVSKNDAGQIGRSEVFSFETVCDTGVEAAFDCGLLQQRFTGVSNAAKIEGTRTMIWDETKAEPVEGAIAAYTTSSFTSLKTGKSYAWGDNVGFIYRGFIRLEGGLEYTFRTFMDDTCEITIDGAVVLTQSKYEQSSVAKVVKETTGWYPIQIITSNGSGGAGGVNSFGIGWSTEGRDVLNAENMNRLVDPGDGSLLSSCAVRAISVTAIDASGDGVRISATATDGNPIGEVWAVWGKADLGVNSSVSDWEGAKLLGTVGPDRTEISGSLDGFDPAATPIVCVVIVSSDGNTLWSLPVTLDERSLLIGQAEAVTDGDRMTVTGSMLGLGSGGDASLELLWGYREDMSDAQNAAVTIGGNNAFSVTVATLPATNGWWRLVARTSDGGYDATLPAAFKTGAGSALKPIASGSVSHHTVTVKGTLNVLGAGTTTVTVWAGDDPGALAPVASSAQILTRPGDFTLSALIPGAPRTVWWKIVSENVSPGGMIWTSETPVYLIATVDAATYTWNIEKTEGDWNDPANWTVSGVPDAGDATGYPNHAKASVVFLPGTAATVHVPAGTWQYASMTLNCDTLDLKFVGEGSDVSVLNGDIGGAGESSAWTDWRVVFDNLTVTEANSVTLGGVRTRNSTLRLENRAVLSVSGWQDIRGTNVWLEAVGGSSIVWRNGNGDNAGLVLYVADGGLRLEDSSANPPCLCYQRGNGSIASGAKPGEQYAVIKGDSVLRVRKYMRPYSESEDTGAFGRFTMSFHVPTEGWVNLDDDAPVFADYARGSSDNLKFAWRPIGKEVPVVITVDPGSPLLRSGRERTVQLIEWNSGIDVKNVVLQNGKRVRLYYTYGFPQQSRTEPSSAEELPTGVAAHIMRVPGTVIRVR